MVSTVFVARWKGLDGLCPSFATRKPDCVRLRRELGVRVLINYRQNKKQHNRSYTVSYGALEGTRTPDLLVRSQSLYPTELPAQNGADDEARTRYLHLGKVALYQMSYIRKCKAYYTYKIKHCQGVFL